MTSVHEAFRPPSCINDHTRPSRPPAIDCLMLLIAQGRQIPHLHSLLTLQTSDREACVEKKKMKQCLHSKGGKRSNNFAKRNAIRMTS